MKSFLFALLLGDGRWEIEVYRDGRKRKLHVDPVSAKILSERDDD